MKAQPLPLLLVLSCAVLSGTSACTTAPVEENTEDARAGIVGGQATGSLPAVGAITRFGSPHCTGTLVAPRKVVTAAHCLVNVSASSLRFAIGPNSFQPESQVNVASVTPHPDYNPNSLANDIGFITLSQDAPVAPMRTLPSMDASFVGVDLIFVGYGASNGFSQTGSGIKRFVVMPVAQVGATQFSYSVPNKNTCNGDSGGPAFAQVGNELLLAGVTSYGDANCVQFGVDTRVDTYADFLGINNTPTDPCQGETFVGRCDGNTVIWCESDNIESTNCEDTNRICVFNEENQYFACGEPEPEDPCNGETFEGRCDGNKVIWCENEQVEELTCGQNFSCGFDGGKGFYNCLQN